MISFFTHPGGAGQIRGKQIASYLDVKLNPTKDFENDICIYVKCVPPENYPEKTYIDVVEDSAGFRWVKDHPTVGIIASSVSIYEHLKGILKNFIVLIPQHHCNFERAIRTRKEVKIAGIIGNRASFQYPLDDLRKKLEKIGIELKTLIKKTFESREEVVEFYKQIDIQLVWRPESDRILRNPLKFINAMSFGIPTVAYPETDFIKDPICKGWIIRTETIKDLLFWVNELKTGTDYYNVMSFYIAKKAEEYHISNIAKLYLKL